MDQRVITRRGLLIGTASAAALVPFERAAAALPGTNTTRALGATRALHGQPREGGAPDRRSAGTPA
jgi:hypothetical protein